MKKSFIHFFDQAAWGQFKSDILYPFTKKKQSRASLLMRRLSSLFKRGPLRSVFFLLSFFFLCFLFLKRGSPKESNLNVRSYTLQKSDHQPFLLQTDLKSRLTQEKTNPKELNQLPFSLIQEPLREFQEAAEVILKTEREKEDFKALLSNPATVQNTLRFLMETDPGLQEKDQWMGQRIDAIQYLDAALKWQENPMRREIIVGMVQFIEQVQPQKEASPEERKIIYGDQISLLISLREQEPEEIHRIRAAGIKKKLVKFADNFYQQQMRGRENGK